MRRLYTIFFYLALPFIFLRLWWRGKRLPAYRERLAERLGHYPFSLNQCIWVHAVSVGETIAAIPLIKRLQTDYPLKTILVTTMTPTGAERVQSTFKENVHHVYLPYDYPQAVKRFLTTMKPIIGIIVETELWPNLLNQCQAFNIPTCLINARLSARSAKGYQRIQILMREMLEKIDKIASQGKADAERFIALGAKQEQVIFTGNLKFDAPLSPDRKAAGEALRKELGEDRFVWIAASTHEGEEESILASHKALLQQDANALLILVPRHPDRFETVAKLCQQSFTMTRRSENSIASSEIYLGDTMGELLMLYAAADVAFVGGSLIPRGGHNLLEPAALAKPILSGPHRFNFAEISEAFVQQRALIEVNNSNEMTQALMKLKDPTRRTSLGKRAAQVVNMNRGALEKQIAVIKSLLHT